MSVHKSVATFCSYLPKMLFACSQQHRRVADSMQVQVLEHIHSYVFQNSPEVDDEGYSIRPDEELEGDILHAILFVTELLFFSCHIPK